MKKNFLSILFLCFFSISYSQKTEIGLGLGGSLFKGDVNTNFAFKETKPAFEGFFRYYLSNKFALRSSLLYTTVSGNDYKDESFNDKKIWRKLRNLSFRSRIVELSIRSEYFLRNLLEKKSSPYAFAGIGLFYFNPQAKYQGKWYDLHPLGTEGQGLPGYKKEYKRLQPNAIFGLGWKFKMNARLNLGIEAGLRITHTDYIDDVSGKYANKSALQAQRGSVAAALSNRSGEVDLNAISIVAGSPYNGNYVTGQKRGNPDKFDKYLVYNITVSYRLFKITPKMYNKGNKL